jgi:hypothetical protein
LASLRRIERRAEREWSRLTLEERNKFIGLMVTVHGEREPMALSEASRALERVALKWLEETCVFSASNESYQ